MYILNNCIIMQHMTISIMSSLHKLKYRVLTISCNKFTYTCTCNNLREMVIDYTRSNKCTHTLHKVNNTKSFRMYA